MVNIAPVHRKCFVCIIIVETSLKYTVYNQDLANARYVYLSYYRHSEPLPPNLLSLTINCTQNELTCPVKIYSAISRHKFPYGSKISAPYRGPTVERDNRRVATVARRLDHPETYGPDAAEPCVLECVELCAGCQRVLYHGIKSAGVISALKVRVLGGNGKLLADWSEIYLSVYFDYSTTAQIDRQVQFVIIELSIDKIGHTAQYLSRNEIFDL